MKTQLSLFALVCTALACGGKDQPKTNTEKPEAKGPTQSQPSELAGDQGTTPTVNPRQPEPSADPFTAEQREAEQQFFAQFDAASTFQVYGIEHCKEFGSNGRAICPPRSQTFSVDRVGASKDFQILILTARTRGTNCPRDGYRGYGVEVDGQKHRLVDTLTGVPIFFPVPAGSQPIEIKLTQKWEIRQFGLGECSEVLTIEVKEYPF